MGYLLVRDKVMREVERSMASVAWLMPYDTFWRSDEVLVKGRGPTLWERIMNIFFDRSKSIISQYTVNDYKKFFDDLNYPTGFEMRKDTEHLIKVNSELCDSFYRKQNSKVKVHLGRGQFDLN